MRVRLALANSLNVPAVRVLEKMGVQTFLDRLHQLGFEHLTQSAEYYGLGLTLGSGEVSLWELAKAYVTMARQGQPTYIVTRLDSTTQTNKSPYLPTSGVTWQLMTDMLSDRHARATVFGVDSILSLPFSAAVKTGTSSNFRDTWTVGFTTDYTVATWVGNFDGDPMRQVSGVMGAAPLWNRIMLHLHEHQEPASFPPPKGMVQLPICAISGLRPTPDCSSVVQEYFYAQDVGDYERQNNFTKSSEYDEWLARQNQSSMSSDKLKIVSPHQNDVFLLYPDEKTKQRLEFKLAGTPTAPVEWWLNGQKLATNSSDSVFWTLRPGRWTLEAKSGEMSGKVSFQVELASVKPTRRGFSVGYSH